MSGENLSTKIFTTRIERTPSTVSLIKKAHPETIRKVQSDLEKRLGPRKVRSQQFDISEIQQVAEIVTEVLEKRTTQGKMTSSDTRVAPASALNAAAPKRQQVYTDQAALPPIPSYRNGSVESEDHLRGIYTLPSNDPENPQRQQKSGAGNSPYFSGKIVANILAVIQIALVLLFAIFVYYEEETVTAISKSYIESQRPTQRPNYDNNFYNPNHNERPSYGNEDSRYDHEPGPIYQPAGTTIQDSTQNLHQFYYFYQDVHVMIFVGFGFLMTFLRKYGYSAVGYNMLIAAIAIQWSVICRGIFHHNGNGAIPIDITTLINGDFAAAAVLITFGAVIGVTSPFQLVVVCLIEVFLYALNEYIGTELLKAIDVGGSMFIHTFGAYFGLSMSLVLRKNSDCASEKEGASYTSDIFAMIGTVFLWMFWPSFNGAMAEGDDQHRAVLNTVLSLAASCVFTFAVSGLVGPENKFSMVHVQNASLAGGVAVGAVADLMIRPYGALIIGSIAGILSTIGYAYITPFLQSKLNLHDTCGVNNLHGMPGIMAGLAGVVMAFLATEDNYGISLYKQYPAMAPLMNSSGLNELRKDLTSIEPGDGRSASNQALFQLLALGVTLCIAIVGGAITGLLMRFPLFGYVPDIHLFDDSKLWEVPEEGSEAGDNAAEQKGEVNQGLELKPDKG